MFLPERSRAPLDESGGQSRVFAYREGSRRGIIVWGKPDPMTGDAATAVLTSMTQQPIHNREPILTPSRSRSCARPRSRSGCARSRRSADAGASALIGTAASFWGST